MRLTPEVRFTLHVKLPLETTAAVPLQLTVETPASESEALPVMVMGEVSDADPVAGEAIVTIGPDRSIFTSTLAVAVFPEESTTVPVTVWFAPSDDTTCAPGHWLMEALPAPQLNVTVTGDFSQPFAFGAGDSDATICGADAD